MTASLRRALISAWWRKAHAKRKAAAAGTSVDEGAAESKGGGDLDAEGEEEGTEASSHSSNQSMDRLYLNREAILEDIRWQREQGLLEFDHYNEDAVTDEGIQAFLEHGVSSGSIRSIMMSGFCEREVARWKR